MLLLHSLAGRGWGTVEQPVLTALLGAVSQWKSGASLLSSPSCVGREEWAVGAGEELGDHHLTPSWRVVGGLKQPPSTSSTQEPVGNALPDHRADLWVIRNPRKSWVSVEAGFLASELEAPSSPGPPLQSQDMI